MTNTQIEVITSVQRRRRWSRAEKERIVAAALEPGAVASEVAREAGIHTSQLFRWRQQLCKREPTATAFNAVAIAHEPSIAALPSPPAVFFYSPDRGGKHPEQHLASYAGLMQADAYAGFDRLYRPGRKPGPIIEAACWAHARRYFFELARLDKAPIAIEAVKRIDALFAIEREINGIALQERLRVRSEQSRPLVVALEAWLREQRAKLSGQSKVAKAIAYSLTRWVALTRFLDDGRLCMSNNAAEREIRPLVMGRHNWTFAGSDQGGHRAAAIYTLVQTAKLNDVDPQAWLADVLARLQDHPAKRINELLPWNWKSERQQKAAA